MCHLPKNKHCEVCAKAKIQRKHKTHFVAMIEEDGILAFWHLIKQPVKLGDQVTGDHMIRSEDATEDTDVPVDTVAAVFLDRATTWTAV